jgi:hypothetical protein
VAWIAIERLVSDGRIHLQGIEEIVSKVAEEIGGEDKRGRGTAIFDLGTTMSP